MKELRQLYRQRLLTHHRSPRFGVCIDSSWPTEERLNPSCGDRIRVGVLLRSDRLHEQACEVEACAITRASASIMYEACLGKTVPELAPLLDTVEKLIRSGETGADLAEDLQALGSIAAYPMRVSCGLLPWQALRALLPG